MDNLAVLVAFTLAITELVKAILKAFNLFTNDEQREVVLRVVAIVVGVLVAVAFQYDALNPTAPTIAGIIVSGALLALGSDLVHVGIDVGKKVATPSVPTTKVEVPTAPSTGTTASVTTTSPEPLIVGGDTQNYKPYTGALPHD